jgi:hypothetical protein
MNKITLHPQVGVQIEGKSFVSFGDTEEQVVKAWGKPNIEVREGRVEYTDYGFFADFKDDGTFEAVEFWNYMDSFVSEVYIYGKEVLQNPAAETLAIIKEKNGNEDAREGWFYNVDVTFSGGIPGDFEKIIEQYKQDGTYEESKGYLEEDYKKSHYFSSFGIGYKGYCNDGYEELQKIMNS